MAFWSSFPGDNLARYDATSYAPLANASSRCGWRDEHAIYYSSKGSHRHGNSTGAVFSRCRAIYFHVGSTGDIESFVSCECFASSAVLICRDIMDYTLRLLSATTLGGKSHQIVCVIRRFLA